MLYDELLAQGVRIYEYTPAFLHAKVALVDDDWATVGSSNIDPLSLLLNLEANVIVHRRRPSPRELRAQFEQALAESREVTGAGAARLAGARRGARWSPGRRLVYLRMAGITRQY